MYTEGASKFNACKVLSNEGAWTCMAFLFIPKSVNTCPHASRSLLPATNQAIQMHVNVCVGTQLCEDI